MTFGSALDSVSITAENFLALVVKQPNGCWLRGVAATKPQKHYSACCKTGAHRVSYVLFKGPIPRNTLVRHRCDNPPCVNPDHLELGTSEDNRRDERERRVLPSLRYRIRTSDGATLSRVGKCTDRQAFAVYLIGLLGDEPGTKTPAAEALGAYLDACEKALAEKKAEGSHV
jgi:hypothetical protein